MLYQKNERNTENIVREALRSHDYYDPSKDIVVEEQKSNIDAVKRLLRSASKSGQGGIGSPEFIISAPSTPDFLVIVECKADPKDHISPACAELLAGQPVEETDDQRSKRTQRYAVDGVLHYAQKLSKEYNVVAVAVSGEEEESSIVSTHLHPKGASSPKQLLTKDGANIDRVIPWSDYIQHGTFDPAIQRIRFDQLMAFSRDLHNFMRDHAKLTESEKPLVVSGTLIALRNKAFALSYDVQTPEDLQLEWMRVIQGEIHKADGSGLA